MESRSESQATEIRVCGGSGFEMPLRLALSRSRPVLCWSSRSSIPSMPQNPRVKRTRVSLRAIQTAGWTLVTVSKVSQCRGCTGVASRLLDGCPTNLAQPVAHHPRQQEGPQRKLEAFVFAFAPKARPPDPARVSTCRPCRRRGRRLLAPLPWAPESRRSKLRWSATGQQSRLRSAVPCV